MKPETNGEHVNPERICHNCGGVSSRGLQRGMCPACYRFWLRHGKLRNKENMTRVHPGGNQKTCINCHQDRAMIKEMCMACYQYNFRTGRNRPRRLWIERCINCGKPKTGPRTIIFGRCMSCYNRWRKYGEEKKVELIKWCDCGEEAVHFDVKLNYMLASGCTREEGFDLCQNCYELEQETIY